MRVKDLTPVWLLEEHFFGIYKRDISGVPFLVNPNDESDIFPQSVIRRAIGAAIARITKHISAEIKLNEHVIEHHDYDQDSAIAYFYTRPRKYPVVRVHAMKIQYGENGSVIWDIPASAIQVKANTNFSMIQVMPQYGTLSSFDPATAMFAGFGMHHYAPSMIYLDYDAGIEGTPDELDDDLVRAIGLMTSIHLFNILGDIIIGAGIASISTSFDGFSQSVGTTASAENSAFSARILEYERELYGKSVEGMPGLIATFKKKYERIFVGVL